MRHSCLMATEFGFGKMREVLEMDGSDGCIMLRCLLLLTVHSKLVKMVTFMLCIFYHNSIFKCL